MRKIFSFGVIIFLSLVLATITKASDLPFSQKAIVTYELTKDNSVKATYDIRITNNKTESYAPSITINTEGFSPSNVESFENGVSSSVVQDGSSYKIVFKNPVVGVGKTKKIIFTFEDNSLVTSTPQITNLHIPQTKDLDSFSDYSVNLKIPVNIDKQTTITPTPVTISTQKDYKTYSFVKADLLYPINLSFGEFQDYSYSINYPPESLEYKNGAYVASLPSDSSYQQVLINNISIAPDNVAPDQDGNWIMQYAKQPKEKISVTGVVRLFVQPKQTGSSLSTEMREKYTAADKYWEVNDQYIRQYAKNLKTPNDIYNFVIANLSYNFGKTNRPTNRLGAANALKNPKEAICMEFTDLFIALARAAGIPAREVNGYAYTNNEQLQPISWNSDVLHSWPEYWDNTRNIWVEVDPTWGKTTNGVDYFTKFDTNHFALVIRGLSSVSPKTPGTIISASDPGKLIDVSSGADFTPNTSFDFSSKYTGIPFVSQRLALTITNHGNSALTSDKLKLSSYNQDSKTLEIDTRLIPPFGKDTVSTPLKNGYVLATYKQKQIDVPLPIRNFIGVIFIFVSLLISFFLGLFFMLKYAHANNKFSIRSK